MSLEDKVKDGPSVAGSFLFNSLLGTIFGYIAPLSVPLRAAYSVAYGAVMPLIEKIFYPDVPLSRLYKTAPAGALGVFTGETLGSYLKYI